MSKKILAYMLVMIIVMLSVAGCGGGDKAKTELKGEIFVSAAASLTDAMKELAVIYQKQNSNAKITFNFGSSGALQAQIQQGAPADVFVSAAQKQMNALEEKDLVQKDTRKDLLVNKVVLITAKDKNSEIKNFQDVIKAKHIALGEPKGVPVGQYSEQIFTKLNMLDDVKGKAVYGSDVRQVLAWVENGEAEVGVVYATDAAVSKKVQVICTAPAESHKPVIYPAAVLKNSKNPVVAQDFLAFLSSKEAGEVFKKYGFEVK